MFDFSIDWQEYMIQIVKYAGIYYTFYLDYFVFNFIFNIHR
jgi:hypothetical protein